MSQNLEGLWKSFVDTYVFKLLYLLVLLVILGILYGVFHLVYQPALVVLPSSIAFIVRIPPHQVLNLHLDCCICAISTHLQYLHEGHFSRIQLDLEEIYGGLFPKVELMRVTENNFFIADKQQQILPKI